MTAKKSKGRVNGDQDGPIIIKKYANRRLYNTATSAYVTLDFLAEMVKNGEDFVAYDAKSGEDITRAVLTQIIFEEESKGASLLPIEFLRQLIKYYGDSLQTFVPTYLEMSMKALAHNQDDLRQRMRDAFGATPGYAMFEEGVRKNMEFYNQAMQMFSPVNVMAAAGAAAPPNDRSQDPEIAALQAEIDRLRNELAGKKDA